jgi:hypothetical protein
MSGFHFGGDLVSSRKKAKQRERRDAGIKAFVTRGDDGGRDVMVNGAAQGFYIRATSCVLRDADDPSKTRLDVLMTRLYPNDTPPELSNAMREQVLSQIRTLLYDTRVRRDVLGKLRLAEAEAWQLVRAAYADYQKRGVMRDSLHIMSIFDDKIRPHHKRAQEIGLRDVPLDPLELEYYFDCVWVLSRILNYTSFAKRHTSIFKRFAVGLLYKLQKGFSCTVKYDRATGLLVRDGNYSSAAMGHDDAAAPGAPITPVGFTIDRDGGAKRLPTLTKLAATTSPAIPWQSPDETADEHSPTATARVVFIPKHPRLARLPTLNDLNGFDGAFAAFGGSKHIIDTHNLVWECYKSVLESKHITRLDQLEAYRLTTYVELRYDASDEPDVTEAINPRI